MLTEENFQEIVLDKIFPGQEWVHNKCFPQGYRYRPDFRCEELKIIVEFNGYRHYTQSQVILRDYEKKKVWEDAGYKVVHFPYWLQPDEETIAVLFNGIGYTPQPHYVDAHQGFISDLPSDVLPADFCKLGVRRFNRELSEQTVNTIYRVNWSLEQKAKKYGEEAVFCSPDDDMDDFGITYKKDNLATWFWVIHETGEDECDEIGGTII